MATEYVSKDIDPGRLSIGKGLLWATGSFGCEREAWYGETVRDERGWRLRHPMPEKVHFGKAIDVLHAAAMKRRIDGREIEVDPLVDLAYHAGIAETWAEEEQDDFDRDAAREVFRVKLDNAARLLVGEVAGPPAQAEGVPLDWMPLEGVHIQGLNGVSLEVPNVFGDRPLGGTPDYVYVDQESGTMVGWIDVKAVERSHSYPDKWLGAEATIYTYLLTVLNGGQVPGFIGYLEYRRLAKPYWHMTIQRNPIILAGIADRYIRRWRRAIEIGDPEVLSFNPKECADCPYSRPIPEAGFPGCEIGAIVNRGLDPEEGADS